MGRDAKTSAAGLFTPPAGGGLVAVAAPAGAVDARDFEAGLDALGRLVPECGIKVEQGVFDRQGYLAGPDQSRARALAGLFADARVQTIISARGGFGSSRLLPLLDLGAMAASKTLFMGFSDISCLLCCLAGRGLVTVHGPVVTQIPRLDGPSLADLKNLLNGRPPWPMTLEGSPVAPGQARGRLMGGNLTMLCHLMGTRFFPDLAGAVLFLEETGEAPYRLDRLLTQLELAGIFLETSGVALGWLSEKPGEQAELEAVAAERLAGLGKPVVSGLAFGHGTANRCLPVGALASIDGNAGILTVGEELV